MTLDTVYQTVQSAPGGGSGRGVSFWETPNFCGRQAKLKILNPPPAEAGGTEDEPNALRIGTFYHALHEASLAGQQAGQVWDMSDTAVQDPDWMEALRLYRAYTRDWESPLVRFRALLKSVEIKMPQLDSTRALVRELFGKGEEDVTFKADWIGEVSDLDHVQQTTGLHLREPGLYIFDHKTAGARKPINEWKYTFGNQALTYLHLYNLEHPEAPAKGMIFDEIIKHVDISKDALRTKTGTIKRESSYTCFVAYPNEDAEKIIRNLVQRGMYELEGEGRANSAQCFNGYKPCWYFQNGLCPRY